MKLKKKTPNKEIKIEKMVLSGELAEHLEQYQKYYEHTYQANISFAELIQGMAEVFMKSDRDFNKHIKSSLELNTGAI